MTTHVHHTELTSATRPARRRRISAAQRVRFALGMVAVLAIARGAQAQSAPARPSMDRATLERRIASERRPEEAARLRERLRDGDFNVGDRVVVDLRRDSTVSHDTLVVRAGRMITIQGIPDIPLAGVLRSELDGYLNDRVGKFIKAPNVRTSSLFRLAVLGEVSKPNYYDVPPDMLVSDLVVLAAGPTPNADLGRSVARRGGTEILPPELFRYALRNGQTLDELSFRAGDEVTIGKKKATNWSTIITTASIGISLLVGTISLVRR
jgi:SLBB domain